MSGRGAGGLHRLSRNEEAYKSTMDNEIIDYALAKSLSIDVNRKKEPYVSVFERVYKAEASEEAARNMLRDGLSVEKVSQYTSLPREKIEALSMND
jgi:hypothetical protein